MKKMTWQQGTAVGLATVLGFGVAQEEASGLILEVTSQATEPQPAKPTCGLVPDGHTHQEPVEDGPNLLSTNAASGTYVNASAQVFTQGSWLYRLGSVTTIPPNLPPLPPLTIEREASTVAGAEDSQGTIRPGSSDPSP
jgi:hypothetical protein